MTMPDPLRRWLSPAAWSIGLLAVVLIGCIVSVKMLSDRDAITLIGGVGSPLRSTCATRRAVRTSGHR